MKRTLTTFIKPLPKRVKKISLDEYLSNVYLKTGGEFSSVESWYRDTYTKQWTQYRDERGLLHVTTTIERLHEQRDVTNIVSLELLVYPDMVSKETVGKHRAKFLRMIRLEKLTIRIHYTGNQNNNTSMLANLGKLLRKLSTFNHLEHLEFTLIEHKTKLKETRFNASPNASNCIVPIMDIGALFFSQFAFLPFFLARNNHITSLCIRGIHSSFSIAEMGYFFKPMIGKSNHMKKLDIGNIAFGDDDSSSLQEWWDFLTGCSSLEKISLSGNINVETLKRLLIHTRNHHQLIQMSIDNTCPHRDLLYLETFHPPIISELYHLLKKHPLSHMIPQLHTWFISTHCNDLKNYIYRDWHELPIEGEILKFLTTNNLTKIDLECIKVIDGGKTIVKMINSSPMVTNLRLAEMEMTLSYILKLLTIQHLQKIHLHRAIDEKNVQFDKCLKQIATTLTYNTTLLSLDILPQNSPTSNNVIKALNIILGGNFTLQRFCFYFDWSNLGSNLTRRELYHTLFQKLKKNYSLLDYGHVSSGIFPSKYYGHVSSGNIPSK